MFASVFNCLGVSLSPAIVIRWELKHAIVDILYGIAVEALFMLQVSAATIATKHLYGLSYMYYVPLLPCDVSLAFKTSLTY